MSAVWAEDGSVTLSCDGLEDCISDAWAADGLVGPLMLWATESQRETRAGGPGWRQTGSDTHICTDCAPEPTVEVHGSESPPAVDGKPTINVGSIVRCTCGSGFCDSTKRRIVTAIETDGDDEDLLRVRPEGDWTGLLQDTIYAKDAALVQP